MTARDPESALAAAQQWIIDDIDEADREELSALVVRAQASDPAVAGPAREELTARMRGPLAFGTAGLRGPMGAGEHRMNRSVVVRAAAGVGDVLTASVTDVDPNGPAPLVVVGFDARHRSAAMALDTAAVLTAQGVRVALMDAPRPTPVTAFALRHLKADAAIMVTASHNPAGDNGYKVYLGGRVVPGWGQGSQIVPPWDSRIADAIAGQPGARLVPRATSGWELLDSSIEDAYLAALPIVQPITHPLTVVTTAMHGVGAALLKRALQNAGVSSIVEVAEQRDPDPDFPTVAFPNPEEPGALDLALAAAHTHNADLVIAVDPDADRCAVAVRDPYLPGADLPGADLPGAEIASSDADPRGAWRRLHGDELGSFLGARVAADLHADPHTAQLPDDQRPCLACSIVSSRLLAKIAAQAGLAHRETLTGFKWISRVPHLAFGYEEALGYCVDPAHVRDKDGISAAVTVVRAVADLAERGLSVLDALDDLARSHGLHLTSQVSVRLADASALAQRVEALLAAPPTHLAGSAVSQVTDLSVGTDDVPPTTGIRLDAADGTRVIVRPSGTEPKVKAYLEVIVPLEPDSDMHAVADARRSAGARLAALGDQIRQTLTQ